jgi:hypothetical protein
LNKYHPSYVALGCGFALPARSVRETASGELLASPPIGYNVEARSIDFASVFLFLNIPYGGDH